LSIFSFEFQADPSLLNFNQKQYKFTFGKNYKESFFFENESSIIVGDIQNLPRNFKEIIPTLSRETLINYLVNLEDGFAVVFYDKKTNCVELHRDFFGKIPLYYTKKENNFFVTNNLKTIALYQNNKINLTQIIAYFRDDFEDKPINNLTFFNQIFRLLPGHYGRFNNSIFEEKPVNSLFKKPVETFKDILLKNLDKPQFSTLGSHLSGGLDSSTIVSMLAKKNKLETYYFNGGKGTNQEINLAKDVSEHFKTVHSVINVPKNSYESVFLTSSITYTPELLVIPSSTFLNIQTQAKLSNIDKIYSGHGGDTVVGSGFEYFDELYEKKQYSALKLGFESYANAQKDNLEKINSHNFKFTGERLLANYLIRKFKNNLQKIDVLGALKILKISVFNIQINVKCVFDVLKSKKKKEKKIVLKNLFNNNVPIEITENLNYGNLFFKEGNKYQKNQIDSNFVSLSAHALETFYALSCHSEITECYPLLNKNLLEVSLYTDLETKFYNGLGRGVLRRAMEGILPKNILNRTSKVGFNDLHERSFLELWSDYKSKMKPNDKIWEIINKKTFDFAISAIFDDKFTKNQKRDSIWFCSKVVSLAIWLEVLEQR
jgi:asparagine synthase (glutamine-hydrolysing)